MEHPGDRIDLGPAWQYRLEAEIARSTFGVVWQAQWLQTGTRVALKTVHRARMLRAAPEQQGLWPQALRHEAEYLRRMDHPHLVRLRHDGQQDEMPVLVLEQLHTSLARYFRQYTRPLPLMQALEQVRQVASGLAYLHGLGLRHLDVKPENLLLTAPGPLQRLKIADLGAAVGLHGKVAASQEHGFTGSVGWLAPEQVLPSRIEAAGAGACYYRTSARTDVYALGLLLFFLLTGVQTWFSQQAALALQTHAVLEQRDFLEQLAQTGLSEEDSAHLALGLHGQTDTTQNPTVPPVLSGATWAPCDVGAQMLPAKVALARVAALMNKSQMQTRVEALLGGLLAANPAQRLCNAAAVCQAVTAAQCACSGAAPIKSPGTVV